MLHWSPLQHPDLSSEMALETEHRIEDTLCSWVGTPYRKGQMVRGTGVDCVRFLAGVLDDLYGYKRALPSRLPADMSLHDPPRARAAMRMFLRLYEPHDTIVNQRVEALDVLVLGPRRGGPGHAALVSSQTGLVYHAGANSVCRAALSELLKTMRLFRIVRVLDKNLWWRP